MNQRY